MSLRFRSVKPVYAILLPLALLCGGPAAKAQTTPVPVATLADAAPAISNSALWDAVDAGDFAKANAALAAGADPNYKNPAATHRSMPSTPVLMLASQTRNARMAALLIQHGADPNARDSYGYTPISSLGPGAPVALAKTLLDAGADTEGVGLNQTTALSLASAFSSPDLVRLLLAHHANVRALDSEGATPLHMAACAGRLDVFKLLLDHGADLYATTRNHSTMLHVASQQDGHTPMLRYLLQHGFEINLKDQDGETPLHVAVDFGCLENVKFLLAHGADVHTRAKDGKTLIACVYNNDGNSPELVKNAKAIVTALKAAGEKS
ncbi:hypothetical protein CCAX7_57780 [Capsulimonas corticalis]|uniref:Uncharacterized protein n=1 Tax=Capsulimonas corticalis TaxID=2219043 RepID=A0A402D064_9BACT|nr:ankyrin repeat domain-containing protein [Capsulimonas corticalis]BDI33727.1 hypothetical protein CCAX7_57780 [Capsulimonas corticalis]